MAKTDLGVEEEKKDWMEEEVGRRGSVGVGVGVDDVQARGGERAECKLQVRVCGGVEDQGSANVRIGSATFRIGAIVQRSREDRLGGGQLDECVQV